MVGCEFIARKEGGTGTEGAPHNDTNYTIPCAHV